MIRTALIFMFFLTVGVLDCYISDYALKGGATEANPLLAAAQARGVFVECKLAVSLVAAVAACLLDFLYRRHRLALARYGFVCLAAFYLCLGAYQLKYYHTLTSLEQQRLAIKRLGDHIRSENHL